eukprot:1223148-Ditylum_brightwellii.AAC.1
MTESEFLSIRKMEDSEKESAMSILVITAFYTFFVKQEYIPILLTLALQLTLQYGVCDESCIALADCSLTLLLQFKDFNGSKRMADLAMILLLKLDAKKCIARVFVSLHGGVFAMSNHPKRSLKPLLKGYQEGMFHGDIGHAFINVNAFLLWCFISGHQTSEAGVLADQKVRVQLRMRENHFDLEKRTSKESGYEGLATFYECLTCVAMA